MKMSIFLERITNTVTLNFVLSPDLGENDHFNLTKSGRVMVNLTFAQPLPQAINVIVYAEFQNVLEKDRYRNVF